MKNDSYRIILVPERLKIAREEDIAPCRSAPAD